MRLSLSVLEKFLLKSGFEVANHCDAASGLILCTAERAQDGASLTYPHPLYEFHGLDRDRCTLRLAEDMAALWGLSPEALSLQALAGFDLPPEGFACRLCGHCCSCLGDASHGRVSPEEVREWTEAGLTRILRLIRRVDRPAYSFYEAWVNPKTGRYLKRCPWLVRLSQGGRGCAIHENKPLKCRAYPYNAESAQRQGCIGFDQPDLPNRDDAGRDPGWHPGDDPGRTPQRPALPEQGAV